MKISKKIVSLLLAATMILSCFAIAIPFLKLNASAATTIDGVTQERVVGTDGSYKTTYENYAATYLNGASTPTDIVIPGLNPAQDYVIQGMTYYPKRDWMLVTAYHNVADGETTQSSKVFALDAKTGDFVAMFSFLNTNNTTNTDHGGGIAVSEHNIYYSCGDKDRKIAYAPISWLENAVEGQHTVIELEDEIVLNELGDAYTAYVCYDEGILWVGNFFDKGKNIAGIINISADYNGVANSEYNSMVFGYELRGNSSSEEWNYLKGTYKNLLSVTIKSGSGSLNGGNLTWNAYQNGDSINITGNITAPTAYVGEFIADFGSFNLTEGVNYTIEFTSTNNNSDMYMFAPNGTHCNVKLSSQTTITRLKDGRYRHSMNFTAGLMPAGADSSWPTTQSTSGAYTGTYTIRFDQDGVAAGEAREFSITDIKISQANTHANSEPVYDEGYAGSPSYAIGLNNSIKDVQYATVDNGKLYLSRSYGSGTGNSERFGFGDCSLLSVADIDLSVPGTNDITINTASGTKPIKAYDINTYQDFRMMPMSEGLCVVDDNIFITFEGASNKYRNESSGLTAIGNCVEPVDVIWQLDPYELMEVEVAEPEKSVYYEKVNKLSEIKDGEEYIIVHESTEKDPVTQMPYLYALNAFGNFKDHKLSKSSSDKVNGYDGMIGHPISYYSIVEDETDGKTKLYLDNPEIDDIENVRWTLKKAKEGYYRITSTDPYFANCNNLYVDQNHITMMTSNSENIDKMNIQEADFGDGRRLEGGFWIANSGAYFLWCNDGVSDKYNKAINSYYIKNSGSYPIFGGTSEQPGTFHCDALNSSKSNVIGAPIETDDKSFYRDGLFNIYHRVVDEVASTYESRVYTDLKASLQADGTYTVELQTYAISPNHYQYVGERPTDYIIVADTSSSMDTKDGTGIISYNDTLGVASFVTKELISKDAGTNFVNGYALVSADEEIYLKHSDGKYYRVKLAVHTYDLKGWFGTDDQRFWAYYVADDGLYYVIQNDGSFLPAKTYNEFITMVDNGTNYTKKATNDNAGDRLDTGLVNCEHYRFSDNAGEYTRLTTMKAVTQNLVDQIAAQNPENRIALVKYGADASTGFYNTSSTLTTSDYANAFWSASETNAKTLKSLISNMTSSAQTSTEGIEMLHAKNIATNSGKDYTATGDRNLAVILISDGVPGNDSNTSTVTTAANNNIKYAGQIKNAGGFVYTALIGHSSGFDKKMYMEAVSSKYAAAASMTSLGGQSVDGITYTSNLSDCDIDYYLDFGLISTKAVQQNNAVGLDNLDKNSYLREQLTDAFKIPETGWSVANNVKTTFVPGEYDAIGRFTFGADEKAEGVTTNVDTTTRTITVTGYDYSTRYISRGNDGKALKVTITGLLANENAKIEDTSINVKDKTGLYKNSDNMNNNKEFRLLPTEYFNIPTYNFTLDFAMDMLDRDVNGTLKAVSNTLSKQDTNNYNKGEAGDSVRIESGDQNLIYSLKPGEENKSYVLIQRTEGENATKEYDWFCIKLSPASNVYYEENKFTTGNAGKVSWTAESDGTKPVSYQTPVNPETDIHGYDEGYAKGVNSYSNGTAKKVTITNSAKTSDTQEFTFTGTGFDLISACGPTTGIMTVKVKNAGKLVKGYIVDTYNATKFDGSNTLYHQVPIVSYNNGTDIAATYTVEVNAVYLSTSKALAPQQASITETEVADGIEVTTAVVADNSAIYDELAALGMHDLVNADLEFVWFDDNSILNGGTGAYGTEDGIEMADDASKSLYCYLDGFRIYHPLGTTNDLYIDSEQNSNYINVINELAKDNGGVSGTFNSALAFVTGSLAEGETLSFGNYQSVGPQNELYLVGKTGSFEPGALAFTVKDIENSARVHLGLRAVNGNAKVKIGTGEKAYEYEIKSATEMYYDITNCLTISDGKAVVTIQNTGEGVLAVNNIKLTGGAATAAVSEEDLNTYALAMNAPAEEAFVVNGKVTTEKVEEELPPENEEIPAELTKWEKALAFIKDIFAKVIAFFSDVFVFLTKGGMF